MHVSARSLLQRGSLSEDRPQASFYWIKKCVEYSSNKLNKYEKKAIGLLDEFYEKSIGTKVNNLDAVDHYTKAMSHDNDTYLPKMVKCQVKASEGDDKSAIQKVLVLKSLIDSGSQHKDLVKGQVECRLVDADQVYWTGKG